MRKPARPPGPAYRLKRSVDVFPAADGRLFLLRSGMDDFEVRDPSGADRALLEALRGGFAGVGELEAVVRPHGVDSAGLGRSLALLEEHGFAERDAGESLLGEEEAARYDRQLIYFADIAAPGDSAAGMQVRLGAARVLMLGCGGLGSWTAAALACAGVGELVLVDDDTVEISNLNRQILFSESDVGALKVDAAETALRRANPRLQVDPVATRIRSATQLSDLLDGVGLVVSTADWPAYELPRWVNLACVDRGVPFITAGQFPPLVRVGPMTIPGRSACLECWESRLRRENPRFAEVTEHLDRDPSTAATLGAASGVVGSLLAMEAIHHLTGAVEPASLGRAHVLNLRTMGVQVERVERDERCLVCRSGATEGGLDAAR